MISHPHYYTTYVEWAREFKCPVYLSVEDAMWLHRMEVDVERRFVDGGTETVIDGVTAVKVGGHFEGSLVLHWEEKLFIADSLVTVPVCVLFFFLPWGGVVGNVSLFGGFCLHDAVVVRSIISSDGDVVPDAILQAVDP